MLVDMTILKDRKNITFIPYSLLFYTVDEHSWSKKRFPSLKYNIEKTG